DVTGATLTVSANLTTTGSGGLKMSSAATTLNVNGGASFNSSLNGVGQLSAGTFNLKGSFSTNNNSATNFAPSGTHLTVLNGAAQQAVNFALAGPTQQRFQNLRMANAVGVVFNTTVQINGDFDVTAAGTVAGGGSLMLF